MKRALSVLMAFALCLGLTISVSAGEHAVNGLPSVTLDGVISEAEWGAPVISGMDKAKATDGSFDSLMTYWDFDPSYSGGETIDLYVNNDSVNLYFGLVIHNTVPDSASTGANLWQHQNFTFTFSYSSPETTVPHIEFEGAEYEQYTEVETASACWPTAALRASASPLASTPLNWSPARITPSPMTKRPRP